jgi:hypothetical protein
MAVFEIRRHESQSDNQDLYIIDPHSVGSENLGNLSSKRGHPLPLIGDNFLVVKELIKCYGCT